MPRLLRRSRADGKERVMVDMTYWCESCARKSNCYTIRSRPKCFTPITSNDRTADRKTEPQNYCDDCLYCETCDSKEFFWACTSKAVKKPKTEPQTEVNALYDQIVEDIDTRVKCANAKKVEDEPQTMYYPQVDGITPTVITEDRDTQILDSWQVKLKAEQTEPQTDCSWK